MKCYSEYVEHEDLNLCVIDGYVATDVNFRFVFNSKKHVSVAECLIKNKKNTLKILGYDDIGDKLYSEFELKDYIMISGKLYHNYILIQDIIEVEE